MKTSIAKLIVQKNIHRFRHREDLADNEEFKIPSKVDVIKPVSLSINPAKVSDPNERINQGFGSEIKVRKDHPGSISFGIFGNENVGVKESMSEGKRKDDGSQITTYRPSRFCNNNFKVTTYRPKNFKPIKNSRL